MMEYHHSQQAASAIQNAASGIQSSAEMAANAVCYAADSAKTTFIEIAWSIEGALTAPHVLMRPTLTRDGNMYCALYGEDIASGCAGFGETPEGAMADFDRNWKGAKK